MSPAITQSLIQGTQLSEWLSSFGAAVLPSPPKANWAVSAHFLRQIQRKLQPLFGVDCVIIVWWPLSDCWGGSVCCCRNSIALSEHVEPGQCWQASGCSQVVNGTVFAVGSFLALKDFPRGTDRQKKYPTEEISGPGLVALMWPVCAGRRALISQHNVCESSQTACPAVSLSRTTHNYLLDSQNVVLGCCLRLWERSPKMGVLVTCMACYCRWLVPALGSCEGPWQPPGVTRGINFGPLHGLSGRNQ